MMHTSTSQSVAECPFGEKLQRYWDRLSPQERKMKMDEEGLYSLTLQKIGKDVAEKLGARKVVDCFGGVGGNSIAFASLA